MTPKMEDRCLWEQHIDKDIGSHRHKPTLHIRVSRPEIEITTIVIHPLSLHVSLQVLLDLSIELKGLQSREIGDAPSLLQHSRELFPGIRNLVSMQANLVRDHLGCVLGDGLTSVKGYFW
jgi:hypothetical protein